MRTLLTVAAVASLIASPAAANQFLDYFEYGRAELSPRGYRMVRAVADYARHGHPSRVLIVGHMDTAEAEEFSDELSRRRAQAVATELVNLGIDPSMIEQQGRGASLLARTTPPNTPEPLNRRVSVDVNF
ncbi:MAG: OmpA family protein [Brevundimonas sp.]|uniref:OmpA family protein n=1 Tax=Brevundimonas sp. TaxID=1871086 RepID=UPI0025BC32CA|nr:OmpA family protein [Brevundimonas sp.]MBX3476102.1 OmpA family protein [Brevundimonas sp.]